MKKNDHCKDNKVYLKKNNVTNLDCIYQTIQKRSWKDLAADQSMS